MNAVTDIKCSDAVDWERTHEPVGYEFAVARMKERVDQIALGQAPELVWVLEHPALYTAGTSAKSQDLVSPNRFPVFKSARGGQYTYHGPGQLVAYFMLDLKKRGRDVRAYVAGLEDLIIVTLADFGVCGEKRKGRIGVWVSGANGDEAKIAALGVRISKWVSYHGISINLAPDLTHFDGIVPCGITDYGVTSLEKLGISTSMDDLEHALKSNFQRIFGSPISEHKKTRTA